MEKIEKPKRTSSPDARNAPPVPIRFNRAEREELQAGADLAAEGNLSLYVRTLALRLHRRPPYTVTPLNELMAEARAHALEEAAQQVECLFGVGSHPEDPYKAQARYAEAIRELAAKPAKK